jgi:hypothetical protein
LRRDTIRQDAIVMYCNSAASVLRSVRRFEGDLCGSRMVHVEVTDDNGTVMDEMETWIMSKYIYDFL